MTMWFCPYCPFSTNEDPAVVHQEHAFEAWLRGDEGEER
jgi:hypothetical protein